MDKTHKIDYSDIIMKLLYMVFISFFTGICIAEEWEKPSQSNLGAALGWLEKAAIQGHRLSCEQIKRLYTLGDTGCSDDPECNEVIRVYNNVEEICSANEETDTLQGMQFNQAEIRNAVLEDSECDSCLMKAHHFPPVFPQPPIHLPYYPPHTYPPTCGYGASSICYTMNGNVCNSFIINYPVMTSWLSSCIHVWPFFRTCSQISGPGFGVPVLSSGCHFSGTPCLCGFFGYYEAGNIL